MRYATRHRPIRSAFPTGALLLAAALAPPLAAQEEAAAPTVEELIEKNLDAKGGREALAAVQTARMTGKMSMGGMEAPFVYEWKAPDKVRMEFTIQGMTGIQAYDGETGWMVMPFMGKTDPEKMASEDTAMIKDDADFRGPLFEPESKGYTVAYVGEEEVEGTPTYKLELTRDTGEVSHMYLDQEYYLEIKQDAQRTIRGQEVESETAIGDYKEVGGLLLAHSLDITTSMAPGGGQTLTFETVELNPEIPDERFEMPAPAPAEEGGEGEERGGR